MAYRPSYRHKNIRHRGRHPGAGYQCGIAEQLHPGLSFAAPRGGWHGRPPVGFSGAAQSVYVRHLFQPQAHALGLDEFIFGRIFRYLYPIVFYGGVDGLEDFLNLVDEVDEVDIHPLEKR